MLHRWWVERLRWLGWWMRSLRLAAGSHSLLRSRGWPWHRCQGLCFPRNKSRRTEVRPMGSPGQQEVLSYFCLLLDLRDPHPWLPENHSNHRHLHARNSPPGTPRPGYPTAWPDLEGKKDPKKNLTLDQIGDIRGAGLTTSSILPPVPSRNIRGRSSSPRKTYADTSTNVRLAMSKKDSSGRPKDYIRGNQEQSRLTIDL